MASKKRMKVYMAMQNKSVEVSQETHDAYNKQLDEQNRQRELYAKRMDALREKKIEKKKQAIEKLEKLGISLDDLTDALSST
jgi:hypothetical protein